jgi:hypothetical protein
VKREPTPTEAAILECAKAIDRLSDAIDAQAQREERVLRALDDFTKRDAWVETYRADDRAFGALSDL